MANGRFPDSLYHISIVYHFLLQLSFYMNSFFFLWTPFNILSNSSSSGFNAGIHQDSSLRSLFLSLHKGNFIFFHTFICIQLLMSLRFVFQWDSSFALQRKILCIHLDIATYRSTTKLILSPPASSTNCSGILDITLIDILTLCTAFTQSIIQVQLTSFLNIFFTSSVGASAHQPETSLDSTASYTILSILVSFFTSLFFMSEIFLTTKHKMAFWLPIG